jgi:hypothetical protein
MADLSHTSYAAPAELVQWFYTELHQNNFNARIFIDPTTDIEIIVCRNTAAIRTQLSTVAQPSLRTPPSESEPRPGTAVPTSSKPGSGSEAYGRDIDEETITRLERPIPSKAPSPPPDPAVLIYTTTSNNKRRERQRREKKETDKRVQEGRVGKGFGRTRRVLSAEMVRPETDEDADAESEGEDDESREEVYIEGKQDGQDKMERSAAQVASWFTNAQVTDKKGVRISVSTSPAARAKMVRNAVAIAGVQCAEDWQQYMNTWRKYGHLTSRPTSRNKTSLTHLRGVSAEIRAFYYKYCRVEVSEVTNNWRAITDRIRQVDLWEAFLRAGQTIPSKDLGMVRNGQVLLSQQKVYLFSIIHPEFKGIDSPSGTGGCKREWGRFRHQLWAASRWHTLQLELGYGVLGLIPSRVVSNSWVERTLKVDEFSLWILVIRAWNPRCLEASQAWASTLRRAFSHQGPSRRMKALEGIPSASLKTFGNTATLFGPSDISEVETGGGSGEDAPTPPPNSQELTRSSQLQEWSVGLMGLESDFGFFDTGGVNFDGLDLGVLNRSGVGTDKIHLGSQ